MPIPGARYRWKTYSSGKKVRLAFQGNKVVEVKPKGGEAKMIGRASPRRSSGR
ncbi:MAG TPA: hypothetical protein VE964_08815 [Myxococcales bacterium]|nr:hypothetical protein [Myxococcales bacterium]